MAFKLIESAQRRWRVVNAPHLVALVRAGAAFVNGKLVERPEDQHRKPAASHPRQPKTSFPQPPEKSSSTGLDNNSATTAPAY